MKYAEARKKMTSVTSSTQVSTFEIIRDILLTSSVLSTKFKSSDFYEFDPQVKSASFNGFPFMVIEIPTDTDLQGYVGDRKKEKEFVVAVRMINEWDARSNVKTYLSAIITAIEGARSTLDDYGYHLVTANISSSPFSDVLDQKLVVESEVQITLRGELDV